jgi:hypothetical protein
MEIVDLAGQPTTIHEQAAVLLVDGFREPSGWPTVASARDLGRNHPFLVCQSLGYVVTGVMPDANGRGRPDIYMSKPVRPR